MPPPPLETPFHQVSIQRGVSLNSRPERTEFFPSSRPNSSKPRQQGCPYFKNHKLEKHPDRYRNANNGADARTGQLWHGGAKPIWRRERGAVRVQSPRRHKGADKQDRGSPGHVERAAEAVSLLHPFVIRSSFHGVLTKSILSSYLPAIGRFLIVVTFLEDALRIITQWKDQLLYLHDYRHSASLLSGRE